MIPDMLSKLLPLMNTVVRCLLFPFLILPSLTCCNTPLPRQVLFNTPDSTAIPYRIPALGAFPDGNLIAISDYRPCHRDIGYGRVDVHICRSVNNGKTWSVGEALLRGTGAEGAVDCGFGDAAIVCDRSSGEAIILLVCGNTVYSAPTTNRNNPNRIAIMRSYDKGRTWEAWREITEDIYSIFDESSSGPIQSCFVTSGRIFQSSIIRIGEYYRIYAALCARPNGNRVIFSDDFGRSWKSLGGIDALPVADGDEAKCAELNDGSIMISSRAMEGRLFNIFTYSDVISGAGTWGEAAFSGKDNNGCTSCLNACNGDMLVVPARRATDGRKVNLALQSIPAGPYRSNVSIFYKELPDGVASAHPDSLYTPSDLASNWEGVFNVSNTTSAYSTMAEQKGGLIGMLLEENVNEDYSGYDIVYQAFNIAEVTCGQYLQP